jgi:hypothetical protein
MRASLLVPLVAVFGLLAAPAAAEPSASRFRLEGSAAPSSGARLRGPSGTTLEGAAAGLPSAYALRGPWSGRELRAGFVAVAFRPFTDGDGDGVADAADDCLATADPAQRDSDGDGYGNACDADFDGDGIVGFRDLARLRAGFLGHDEHLDLDGDGVVSFGDLARLRAALLRPPGPSGLRR